MGERVNNGSLGITRVPYIPGLAGAGVKGEQVDERPVPGDGQNERRLLVVDDDQTLLRFIRHAMELYDYDVLEAETAEAGAEILGSGTVPVALVDINLPGMSGIELVRRFSTSNRVATILCTGDDHYSYAHAIRDGATDFLMKPVRVEELALRVERAFEVVRLRMQEERRVGELERLAATDELTGLSNRRRLMANLREEVSRAGRYGRSLSIVMCDLDHFKRLNDTYGHNVGDDGLRLLGHLLREVVRDTDHVYRFGGEEFVVILPETDLAGATGTAERLRHAVEACRLPGHDTCRMTVSVGVTAYVPGESSSDLLERVDRAMYAAKNAGRNRVNALEPEVTPSSHVAGPGMSVLVIDDDGSTRELVQDMLGRHGYRVRTEGTAAAGLQAANHEHFDALLVDLKLPDESGASVIHQLNGCYGLDQMIAITALPELLDSTEFPEIGLVRALNKPLVDEEMVASIEAARRHVAVAG